MSFGNFGHFYEQILINVPKIDKKLLNSSLFRAKNRNLEKTSWKL